MSARERTHLSHSNDGDIVCPLSLACRYRVNHVLVLLIVIPHYYQVRSATLEDKYLHSNFRIREIMFCPASLYSPVTALCGLKGTPACLVFPAIRQSCDRWPCEIQPGARRFATVI